MSSDTQTIHGIKACMAVFEHRPHDIQRIFYRDHVAKQIAAMLRWAASQGMVYRELDEEGMRKVTKSGHHEGLALVTQPLRYGSFGEAADDSAGAATGGGAAGAGGGYRQETERWMALDGVENPHNLGAILRTCAFFGLDGLLAGGAAPESRVNSAALRVGEGGAESLRLCGVPELAPTLARLAASGWSVIGLETGAPPLPAGFAPAPRWMLAVGHEHEGLSPQVREACGAVYSIAGEGRLGSLNVSVATGIALSRLVHPPAQPKEPSSREASRPAGEPPPQSLRPAHGRARPPGKPAPRSPQRRSRPRGKPGRGAGRGSGSGSASGSASGSGRGSGAKPAGRGGPPKGRGSLK